MSGQQQIQFRQTRPRVPDIKTEKKTTSTVPTLSKKEELDLLHNFDLNAKYGPCIGITRLERWERAQEFGLDPPIEVYDIIQHHLQDKDYKECLWYDERGLMPATN